MAQLIFDPISGISTIDNQTVVTVQQLLNSTHLQQLNNNSEQKGERNEDDDVFLCGKCKQQFTCLSKFVNHKKLNCISQSKSAKILNEQILINSNTNDIKVNERTIETTKTVNSTETTTATTSDHIIHLTDSDLLSLGLETTDAEHLNSNGDVIETIANNRKTATTSVEAASNIFQGTIGIPVSFLSGNTLSLSGTSLLLTTTNASINNEQHDSNSINNVHQQHHHHQQQQHHQENSQHVNTNRTNINHEQLNNNQEPKELNSVNLPQNILLNITNPVVCIPTTSTTSSTPIAMVAAETTENFKQTHLRNIQPLPPGVKNTKKQTILKKPAKDSSFQSTDTTDSANNIRKRKIPIDPIKKRHEVVSEVNEESSKQVKTSKLKCNFCERAFTKNFDLQQHIRCHTGEKPFQCVVCGRAFAQKSNVKKHMQTHKVWPDGLAHTLPPQGSNSSMIINDASLMNVNQKNETIENNDINSEGVDSSYVCPYCSYNGKTYFELKSHMKSHKREKVYKCIQSSCGQMFAELEPFLEHIEAHETEMTYRCHQCTKTFNSLPDLSMHQQTHILYPNQVSKTAQRYYRCQKCLNKYTTPAALEHHIATTTHHYACTHCNKVFPCERYLRRHLITHGSGLHICQYCEKTFKTANYLKVHLVIHTGEKPFACNQCKAAFNRRDKLKRHKLVHDPIKRFKCPFRAHTGCPKEFNRPDKLKAHILTHSGIKPHQCSQCGRSFSRRAHLRAHMNGHTNTNSSESNNAAIAVSSAVDNSVTNSCSSIEVTTISNSVSTIAVSGNMSISNSNDRNTEYITLFDCQKCGNLFTSEIDYQRHQCDSMGKECISLIKKVSRVQPSKLKKNSIDGLDHYHDGEEEAVEEDDEDDDDEDDDDEDDDEEDDEDESQEIDEDIHVRREIISNETNNEKQEKSSKGPKDATLSETAASLDDSNSILNSRDLSSNGSSGDLTYNLGDSLDASNIVSGAGHIEIISTNSESFVSSLPSSIVTIDGISFPTIPYVSEEDEN